MTAAHCGSISALTLGLPASTAIPEQKGTLPTAMFYARTPVSSKLKQRLMHEIGGITMLAILRPENTGIQPAPKLNEILVMGIRHSGPQAPVDVLEHIAGLRQSGIVFICVHDAESSRSAGSTGTTGTTGSSPSSSAVSAATAASAISAASATSAGPTASATTSQPADQPRGEMGVLAIRRAMPGHAGRPQRTMMLVGPGKPAAQLRLVLSGSTFDELWDSLCAQTALDSSDGTNCDERLALRAHVAELRAQEAKLTRDHARAKRPAQRNEIYAKLHKIRTELNRIDG